MHPPPTSTLHAPATHHVRGWCKAATRSACGLPKSERESPSCERAAEHLWVKERRGSWGGREALCPILVRPCASEVECPVGMGRGRVRKERRRREGET